MVVGVCCTDQDCEFCQGTGIPIVTKRIPLSDALFSEVGNLYTKLDEFLVEAGGEVVAAEFQECPVRSAMNALDDLLDFHKEAKVNGD